MKPSFLCLFFILTICGQQAVAQTYKPDKYGHINDPKFLALIKERGYQLVGAMDSVEMETPRGAKTPKVIMIARVMKNGKELYLDWNGVEYADQNAIRRAFGMPELYPPVEHDYRGDYDDPPAPVFDDDFIDLDPGIYRSFRQNGKMGYIIRKDTVVPPIYDAVQPHLSGQKLFLRVSLGDKNGIYDVKGHLLVPVIYDAIEPIHSGTPKIAFLGTLNGKDGILSSKGEVSIPFNYPRLYWDSNSNIVIVKDSKTYKSRTGALDTNGLEIAPCIYHFISRDRKENCLIVTVHSNKESKKGIIDLKGNVILDTLYTEINYFNDSIRKFIRIPEGYSRYQHDLEGLIDVKNVKILLPCEYKIYDDWGLTENEWPVFSKEIGEDERLFGLLNNSGNVVLDAIYTSLDYLPDEQLIILARNNRFGIITAKKDTLIPFAYEYIASARKDRETRGVYPKGTFIFQRDGKQGIMNLQEQVLIPNTYEKLEATPFGILFTTANGFGFMDMNQKILLEEQPGDRPRDMKNGVISTRTRQGERVLKDFYGNTVIK